MEHKMHQLIHRGLLTLVELKEPFLKEWKKLCSSEWYRDSSLTQEFDYMINVALKRISTLSVENVDSFILSLLAEYQSQFSDQVEEFESIFLVTTIENIFHKLLTQSSSTDLIDHQAIQSFFSKLLDQALLTRDMEGRQERWIKTLISTNVMPIDWAAVVKKEGINFEIESVVTSNQEQADQNLLQLCTSLKADQIDHLSKAISKLIGTGSNEEKLIQIHFLNNILLICLKDGESRISAQQIDFVKGMYLRQLKLSQLESQLEWKDASLLFLQQLMKSRNAQQAVNAITQGLVDYMPFTRCALFLYSHYEEKGIGVSGYNIKSPSVQQIREEIFELPLIQKYLNSLNYSQPLYFPSAREILPKKYIEEYNLQSIVVLPIYVPTMNKLLGIALLDQGENERFEITTQTFTTLIKFGHYAGELLFSVWEEALQHFGTPHSILTLREKEVLQFISEGLSISETAEKLHLSSYTVRDYVSGIIQKLSAKNRTDAAVKALRMKLIS